MNHPIKDEGKAHPIAVNWRPMISDVVCAFTKNDFELNTKVDGVSAVDPGIAEQNRDYVKNYGEKLVELLDESWTTSCAQWMGTHWEVLIDLCTEGEGVSDLVLSGRVIEVEEGFQFTPGLIYVP